MLHKPKKRAKKAAGTTAETKIRQRIYKQLEKWGAGSTARLAETLRMPMGPVSLTLAILEEEGIVRYTPAGLYIIEDRAVTEAIRAKYSKYPAQS